MYPWGETAPSWTASLENNSNDDRFLITSHKGQKEKTPYSKNPDRKNYNSKVMAIWLLCPAKISFNDESKIHFQLENWRNVLLALVCLHAVRLCDTMNCRLPSSSVHGIVQARILELVASPSSRGSSLPRDWTQVSHVFCIGCQVLYPLELPGKPLPLAYLL